MEGFETVSSAADLSASIPTDAVETANTGPEAIESEPNSPDAEGSDADLDALNDRGEETEDPSPDDVVNEETTEEEAEPIVEAQATDDELPEGVRKATDRNGKPEMRLTPQRYEKFHGAHKTVRELEAIAGEPVTPELFGVYAGAYDGQEQLFGDILSANPVSQGNVMNYWFAEGARAMKGGEVGVDPMPSFTSAMYASLKGLSANPEEALRKTLGKKLDTPEYEGVAARVQESAANAYAKLRLEAATDLVNELELEAAQTESLDLWKSVGHVAKTLGLAYKKSTEMEAFAKGIRIDPVRNLQQENQKLKAQINGNQTKSQAAQLEAWRATNKQTSLNAVLSEAVMPALSDTQAAWEKLPGGKEGFNDMVRDRLHSSVLKTMSEDPRFQGRIKLLQDSASRASEQKRADIGHQIKQAYINQANILIDRLLPGIKSFASTAFRERNAATHQRRENAANHRAPGGSGTPVKRSLVPAGMDFEDANIANLTRSLQGLY